MGGVNALIDVHPTNRSLSSTDRDGSRARVVHGDTSHIEVGVCEQLTWQLESCREARGVASIAPMPRIAAVISTLVTRQLSASLRSRNLYESIFESYIFLAGQAHTAAELAKPPMPVTV
jgi:hypothetical protein